MEEDFRANLPPRRKTIQNLTVRYPVALHERAGAVAKKNRRSLNQQLVLWIENGVENFENAQSLATRTAPPTESLTDRVFESE